MTYEERTKRTERIMLAVSIGIVLLFCAALSLNSYVEKKSAKQPESSARIEASATLQKKVKPTPTPPGFTGARRGPAVEMNPIAKTINGTTLVRALQPPTEDAR